MLFINRIKYHQKNLKKTTYQVNIRLQLAPHQASGYKFYYFPI
nr:MAG TPA: hypothetical protein [Caudoviricetes sp.]